jgi:hypothetical protein
MEWNQKNSVQKTCSEILLKSLQSKCSLCRELRNSEYPKCTGTENPFGISKLLGDLRQYTSRKFGSRIPSMGHGDHVPVSPPPSSAILHAVPLFTIMNQQFGQHIYFYKTSTRFRFDCHNAELIPLIFAVKCHGFISILTGLNSTCLCLLLTPLHSTSDPARSPLYH